MELRKQFDPTNNTYIPLDMLLSEEKRKKDEAINAYYKPLKESVMYEKKKEDPDRFTAGDKAMVGGVGAAGGGLGYLAGKSKHTKVSKKSMDRMAKLKQRSGYSPDKIKKLSGLLAKRGKARRTRGAIVGTALGAGATYGFGKFMKHSDKEWRKEEARKARANSMNEQAEYKKPKYKPDKGDKQDIGVAGAVGGVAGYGAITHKTRMAVMKSNTKYKKRLLSLMAQQKDNAPKDILEFWKRMKEHDKKICKKFGVSSGKKFLAVATGAVALSSLMYGIKKYKDSKNRF